MNEFRPKALLERVLDGIRLGGYPPDVIGNEIKAMPSDEFLDWMDSVESAEWIRMVCAHRRLCTGTEIAMKALAMHLESIVSNV